MSATPQPPVPPGPPAAPSRLSRSRTDRILGGVAAGLASQLNLDPSLVRVGWVLLAIFTGGIFALVYVVMWVIVPEEPGGTGWEAGYPPPGPGAIPGWQPPASGQPAVTGQPVPTGQPLSGQPAAAEPAAGPPGVPGTGASSFTEPGAPWAAPPAPAARGLGPNLASVVIGLVLIIVGGIFLLEQVFPQLDVGSFWPVVPIVIGGALLYAALRPRPGG